MNVCETRGGPLAPPRISVVICTRNRPDKIAAAVTSVLANDYPAFDLTVVDQSTTKATEEVLTTFIEGNHQVTYVPVDGPGLSRAYNIGIGKTAAPLIAFTDDDCIVPRDWLRQIQKAFDDDPACDLLYGQVLAKPSALEGGLIVPDCKFPKTERVSRRKGFRVIGMGANFAARRLLFDRIGGFDEVLGGGAPLRSSQDFDLAFRAFRAGSVITLSSEVTLLHDGGRQWTDWLKVLRNYGMGDGAFYSKHVRCGDMYALTLLVRKLSRLTASAVVKSLLGKRPRIEYLTGILAGIRAGLKFRVDRTQRLYV